MIYYYIFNEGDVGEHDQGTNKCVASLQESGAFLQCDSESDISDTSSDDNLNLQQRRSFSLSRPLEYLYTTSFSKT